MVGVCGDDGCLLVAEAFDVGECFGVGFDVDDVVGEAVFVECSGGCGALYAVGFGVDGDAHGVWFTLFSLIIFCREGV